MRSVTALPIVLLATLSLFLLLATGCGGGRVGEAGPGDGASPDAGMGAIPVRTLAQGTASEYGRLDHVPRQEEGPECMVIGDEEELYRLLSLAGLQLPEPDVDFDRHLVLAAMLGVRNSAGYSISIKSVGQQSYEVQVEVEVSEPEEGAFTAQVLTSPYHLAMVERDAFEPRGELVFIFVDNHGRMLARTRKEV